MIRYIVHLVVFCTSYTFLGWVWRGRRQTHLVVYCNDQMNGVHSYNMTIVQNTIQLTNYAATSR